MEIKLRKAQLKDMDGIHVLVKELAEYEKGVSKFITLVRLCLRKGWIGIDQFPL